MKLLGNGLLPHITYSSVASFNPFDYGTVHLWLDGADADTLYTDAGVTKVSADGQAVYRWVDKSGNANHANQITAGSRPLYKTAIQNGRSVLRFDGGDDNFLVNFSLPAGNWTFFFAVGGALPSGGSYNYLVDSEIGRFIIAQLGDTASNVQWYDGAWKGAAAASGAWQCLTFCMDNAGASVRRNGVQISTGSYTQKALGGSTRIGSNYVPDGSYIAMDLCEMIVYGGALSAGNRQPVESYLMSKWGL